MRAGIFEQFERTAAPDLQNPLVDDFAPRRHAEALAHETVVQVHGAAFHDGDGAEDIGEEGDRLFHVRDGEADVVCA